ncbi:MAG: alkaline phosphatase D family protein [Cyclobacteriaceae bacterium]
MKFLVLLTLGIITLFSCQQEEPKGPYFGNGFRNGWANHESISIWTRLTKNPDLNSNGQEFIPMTREEELEFAKIADKEVLHARQIPDSLTLKDMDGACPGASGEVRLVYNLDSDSNKTMSEWLAVEDDKNFTRQWKLTDLKPGSTYQVTIYARDLGSQTISDSVSGQFVTPPSPDEKEEINFSVVSCHDYNRRDDPKGHKIYAAMAEDELDFYVHTGDIEYYDKKNPYAFTEDLMRFKWDRIFALPLQRSFYTQTTSYWMKDDHDVLRNDAYQGMTYGTVAFDRGLEIFDKEQFPSTDITYKNVRWGKDLEVWYLEGRRYRSKNTDEDGPNKTILGEEQKQWLFRTLKDSDATYKVIISANPILGPDRSKGKNDNHSNKAFQTEGDEIRNYLNQFENVFVCNGDRHWQYVTHFEGSNLWEFGCGAGSDEHAGGWKQEDFRPQHRYLRVKGGYLIGKLFYESDSVKLRFEHRDIDGQKMHEETFSSMGL